MRWAVCGFRFRSQKHIYNFRRREIGQGNNRYVPNSKFRRGRFRKPQNIANTSFDVKQAWCTAWSAFNMIVIHEISGVGIHFFGVEPTHKIPAWRLSRFHSCYHLPLRISGVGFVQIPKPMPHAQFMPAGFLTIEQARWSRLGMVKGQGG